jgi:hypothetical protein
VIDKFKNEISHVKKKKKEDDELRNQNHILEIKEILKNNEKVTSEQDIQLE